MLLTPGDRAQINKTLSGVRGNYRSFRLLWPASKTECPDCGFDELTQSAKDISCTTCDGLGYTFTWSDVEVYGRIQHYDFVALAAHGIPPGIEVGDCVTYISTDVKDMVLDVRESRWGYAYIDDQTFKPYGVTPTGVGHADEWRVEWKRTELDASGH